MRKRSKFPKKKSRKDFSRKAGNVHPRNMAGPTMRGGIRL